MIPLSQAEVKVDGRSARGVLTDYVECLTTLSVRAIRCDTYRVSWCLGGNADTNADGANESNCFKSIDEDLKPKRDASVEAQPEIKRRGQLPATYFGALVIA